MHCAATHGAYGFPQMTFQMPEMFAACRISPNIAITSGAMAEWCIGAALPCACVADILPQLSYFRPLRDIGIGDDQLSQRIVLIAAYPQVERCW